MSSAKFMFAEKQADIKQADIPERKGVAARLRDLDNERALLSDIATKLLDGDQTAGNCAVQCMLL